MADEQYKWLNRETAERLLRGESLEAVDPSARDQAEHLSQALGALSAQAAPAAGELPGEQAALAAFRKAREAAEAERTAAAHALSAARAPAPGSDAGLVRIGAPTRTGIRARRPGWARPARLALAAALTVGTLGGVAVAAGSGVLPTPFGDEHPRPGASVPAGTSTGEPLASPSPWLTPGGGAGTGVPGATGGTGVPGDRTQESRDSGSDEAAGEDDASGHSTAPGTGAPSATSGPGWGGVAAACRTLRDGGELDAGRERALADLAGGSGRVTRYCKVLLAAGDVVSGATSGGAGGDVGTGQDRDKRPGKGGRSKGGGGHKGGGQGDGRGDEDGHGRDRDHDRDHGHPGHGHRSGDGARRRGDALPAPVPAPTSSAGRPPTRQLSPPSPSPSYTAL
ncbi:hypothetical protein AB0F36_31930 [Streptomyces sp. NPDC029080]|uniref:hypothetical protein n=1 Tax=Streptomyces sp. NPDC029080 TaxID=3155017 RepID=UPI0033C8EAD3